MGIHVRRVPMFMPDEYWNNTPTIVTPLYLNLYNNFISKKKRNINLECIFF